MDTINIASVAIGMSMGIAVIAASYGIATIASRAMEAIGRQPEAAEDIRTAMLLPCVLIEGIGLIGAVLSFALLFLK